MDLRLMTIGEMAMKPLSEELVPGLVDSGLVMAIAEPGAGKTFFGIHVGTHVAAGAKWEGRRVKGGPVIYCIAEGVDYFTYRITTAFDRMAVRAADQPFYVLPHSLNMRSGDDGQITEEINALFIAIARLQTNPRLIIFDTLNRYMPGGDENNQKDASAMVRGCEYLQKEFGGTVMLMHHMRKGGDLARGSTVFTGAADQVIFAKKPKGGLTEKPVLWTTEGAGKRKDRGPVNQWFEFVEVAMTKGNMVEFGQEGGEPTDYYVMKTAFTEDGEEYTTETVEETLVMQPCAPPEDSQGTDEESADAAALLTYIAEHPEGVKVRRTIEALGWKSMSKFYKAIGELEDSVEHDKEEGLYFMKREKKGNPFTQGR